MPGLRCVFNSAVCLLSEIMLSNPAQKCISPRPNPCQVLLDDFTRRHSKLLTKGGKRMKIVESESEGEEDKENVMKEEV